MMPPRLWAKSTAVKRLMWRCCCPPVRHSSRHCQDYAPAKAFKFLIDSSGAIALLVDLVIAVSQLHAAPAGARRRN
ncbi:hypothetical protein ACNKHK_17160 [Shigella flexneri]